jgi:GH15 family glucan-1,4-alpha-glucosidase
MTDTTALPAPVAAPASTPIADYGLLADCNSAALVDRAGSIDWLCLPRYDSASVFARLLGPDAGHWSIRPTGEFTSERRYLPGTLVIETTFTTDTGTVRLVDAMAAAEGQRGHDLGFDAPHEILRSVEAVSGTVELEMELAPRPEYGLVRPLFRAEDGGGRTFGGPNRIAVRGSVPVEIEDATMRTTFSLADTANDELLGNFPQAFSHIGLITAAYAIDKAREEAA